MAQHNNVDVQTFLTRRAMLGNMGGGFAGIALAQLLASEAGATAATTGGKAPSFLTARPARVKLRASVPVCRDLKNKSNQHVLVASEAGRRHDHLWPKLRAYGER